MNKAHEKPTAADILTAAIFAGTVAALLYAPSILHAVGLFR